MEVHVFDIINMVSKRFDFFIQVANQNQSLKGLWAAKLNLEGRASLATPEDLALYETKLEELEIELERRKQVGHR